MFPVFLRKRGTWTDLFRPVGFCDRKLSIDFFKNGYIRKTVGVLPNNILFNSKGTNSGLMKNETVDIRNFQCRMISNKGKGSPIIFLHGYMFTSDVWNEVGLLRMLEQRNIPFKAIDMPYGKISESAPRTSSAEKNVALLSAVAGREPVIVGASLGGYIALKYSVSNPVRGLLLAAPVMSMQEDLVKHYPDFKANVSIVYGDGDNIVSENEMKKLSKCFNAELKVYKNASHPAYLDYPERFIEDVLELYGAATGNENAHL